MPNTIYRSETGSTKTWIVVNDDGTVTRTTRHRRNVLVVGEGNRKQNPRHGAGAQASV